MNNKKESNPKQAMGGTKVPFSTLSQAVTAEVGLGMLEGARKYGRHNWRVAGARASTYIDATNRHLSAWWEGENIDPYSGLSHITKAICSLYVLRDAMINENWNDDRPPALPEGWMENMNDLVQEINAKYPDAVEPFTQVDEDAKPRANGAPRISVWEVDNSTSPGISIHEPCVSYKEPSKLEDYIEWDELSGVETLDGELVYMTGELNYAGTIYTVSRNYANKLVYNVSQPEWNSIKDCKLYVLYDAGSNPPYFAIMDYFIHSSNAQVCKTLHEAIDHAEKWKTRCST